MTPCEPRLDHSLSSNCRALLGLIVGLLCSGALASTAFGQTIVNSSFEADAVPPSPGYGPITGWTGASGLNDSAGPLHDNGTIPDGQKVAFIQGANTMRQTVSGFTVGLQYRLRYYENRRIATNPVNLQVTVAGVTVVPTHEVFAVGGSNPYVQKTSVPFTANATDLEIAFATGGSGDFAVLLDKVELGRNLVVLNNNDTGAGSLRQTVIDAPGGSTITFDSAVTGVINQFTGAMGIFGELTIEGPGAGVLRIRALSSGFNSRVFTVNVGAKVAISGLSMTDGKAAGISNSGNVTLTNSTLSSNQPGIVNGGTMTIRNCAITGNHSGRGGGINNSGTLAIANSIISNNSSEDLAGGNSGGGGGIANSGTLTVTNSTFYANFGIDSTIEGGGLYNTGTATVTNSTFSGNTLSIKFAITGPVSGGAGIGNDSGTLTLVNCTVANNFIDSANTNGGVGRGVGIHQRGGTVTVSNSIIAGNTANATSTTGFDFYGTMTSQGYNLLGRNDNTTITGVTTGNQFGTPANPVIAQLAALASNGGPTQTHALLANSPAINAGSSANSPATDQRGFGRNGMADKGAYELNGVAAALTIRSIAREGTGPAFVQALGLPNNSFTIQTTSALTTPFGSTGTAQSDANGFLQYYDASASGQAQRFYRATYP